MQTDCQRGSSRIKYQKSNNHLQFSLLQENHCSREGAKTKLNLVQQLTQLEITFGLAFDLGSGKGMLFSKNMQIR